jgi:hypothetical protein
MMRSGSFRGAHAPPRAGSGASPERTFERVSFRGAESFGEGAEGSTRGACAPQSKNQRFAFES